MNQAATNKCATKDETTTTDEERTDNSSLGTLCSIIAIHSCENFTIPIMNPVLTFVLLEGPWKLSYCHEANWSLCPVTPGLSLVIISSSNSWILRILLNKLYCFSLCILYSTADSAQLSSCQPLFQQPHFNEISRSSCQQLFQLNPNFLKSVVRHAKSYF